MSRTKTFMNFKTMRQVDVPQGRQGKHKKGWPESYPQMLSVAWRFIRKSP